MMTHPQIHSLLDIVAVQERIAETMATVVFDAHRAGRFNLARDMWLLMHRCRVHAEALRAQVADRQGGAWHQPWSSPSGG